MSYGAKLAEGEIEDQPTISPSSFPLPPQHPQVAPRKTRHSEYGDTLHRPIILIPTRPTFVRFGSSAFAFSPDLRRLWRKLTPSCNRDDETVLTFPGTLAQRFSSPPGMTVE